MAVQADIRERTLNKYKEINEQLRDFLKSILSMEKSSSLNEQIDSAINDTGGVSLLSVKNDLLLQYLINLVAVMYRRSKPNQSLNSNLTNPIVLRLCEIRTFLEKIRPIEHKLQYQMDKILKNTSDQTLHYRPNLDNFDNENEENGEENSDDEQEKGKSNVYRPPKLVPVEYNEDVDDKNDKNQVNKRLEYLKRRAYHSDALEMYKNQYSDAPEEIYNSETSRWSKQNRKYNEKVEYEEEYLKRLPQTKRERLQLQRSMKSNGNDVMDHLDDADALFDENLTTSKTKKKGKISRRTKKRLEKSKKKSIKRHKRI